MIWDWANHDASDKPIFWLCDIAGSGKSTVAMSALETWQREGTLGGRFFFSIASNEASTTDKFCSTIARNLAHYIPQLAPHIAESIKRNPSFMQSSLGEQFQTLITTPILRRQQRVILVIDAADECKSGTQRKQLLDALCVAVQECKNLRVFMTSRPDPVIQSTLGAISIKAKVENRLHDVNHTDNVDDIAAYIHRSLDEILSPDKRQRLVEKAQGLFIWASTACRMLNSEATWDTPENVYDRLISVDKAGDIDDVYGLIFERIDPKAQESMCKMLALLLAAFEPLTVDEVQDILTHVKVRGSVKILAKNLGSVLSVDERTQLIQFRHPTLVEYLRRCSMTPATSKFSIKLAEAHGQAASWCLNRLTSRTDGLKFNICQIESSFFLNKQIPNLADRISKFIPRQLQYASSHWCFHVAESESSWRCILKKELEKVTETSYALYWMEQLHVTQK
ncbi:related to S. pombe trp-asp repeat containing protein [Serendipita indica DSM 11827]|uniref:Related to S. pombe trp-asp repeat containing protein n=1 Tax=Serendipita indica (strain DSM 11827) TaxID=1109443 RepID=G4U052_SERID|nr:related to S. pombe trp-asp repeat containing protein [Serendipita indica DSM 11827]